MAQSFFQEDEILGKAYDARLVRRLWEFVRPYRRIFCFTLALVFLASGVDLLAPLITQIAIDRYIVPVGATSLSRHGARQRRLRHGRALSVGAGCRDSACATTRTSCSAWSASA